MSTQPSTTRAQRNRPTRKVYALRIAQDYLEDAEIYTSLRDARTAYRLMAEEMDRYGNVPPEASIHIAANRDEISEYPDYVLSFEDGKVRSEYVY